MAAAIVVLEAQRDEWSSERRVRESQEGGITNLVCYLEGKSDGGFWMSRCVDEENVL